MNGIAVVAKAAEMALALKDISGVVDQPPRHLRQGAAGFDRRIPRPLTATTQNRWLPTGDRQ